MDTETSVAGKAKNQMQGVMTIEHKQKRPIPFWLINIFFFGLLIGFVLTYFFWQMHRIDRSMQNNAMERSRLVAGIIEENLKNSGLAGEAIEQITYTLLNDKAHFIDYLDSIEPLRQSELTALADQSGLTGITLVRRSGGIIAGPENWLNEAPDCRINPPRIQYNRRQGIAYIMHPSPNADGDLSCVIVGLDASRIISVQEKTGLAAIVTTLSSLPGIHYIRLVQQSNIQGKKPTPVTLIKDKFGYSAEAVMNTSKGVLIVGLDAKHFIQRRNTLRNQFFLFGSLLLGVGFFFSWLLYRYQRRNVEQTRKFERMMAREHEAATLGRATATIAHEVRNPLNAINMGLQRLNMESDNLTEEQEELISAMQEAVGRTSTIVIELQRFTRDLRPVWQQIRFDRLVQQQLTLYQTACREQSIRMTSHLQERTVLAGDRELLAELVENILKNAIEAQPEGGEIDITLTREHKGCVLRIKNQGFFLSAEDSRRLGAPYFTTKTRGTGLGLALCRRIAEAHNGRLYIEPDLNMHCLTIRVVLPDSQEDKEKRP